MSVLARQILPGLRVEMGLGVAGAGALIAFINAGTVLAYRLVGPTFDYGYAADGQLLQFHGPPGKFVAKSAPRSRSW